jgi:hypothetical protein
LAFTTGARRTRRGADAAILAALRSIELATAEPKLPTTAGAG